MPSGKFTNMESGSVEDRSATLIGVVVMLLIITTVVVVLRLWTRYVILNQLGPDDFLALISLVRRVLSQGALGHKLTYNSWWLLAVG